MSRSKKVLTDFDIECRKKAASRVKALTKSENTTYKKLADSLGIAESSVRNYASGRRTMRYDAARLFEAKTGIIYLYWTGETDCKTWSDYQSEQEKAESEGQAAYFADERRQEEQLKTLFSRCGFEYENLSRIPGFDFSKDAAWPNKLTSIGSPTISACFTDEELESIFSRLHDVVELECFKKSADGRATRPTKQN